jgi:hypothetical protein
MRESNGIPSWMVKTIAGTVITLLLGSGAAWMGGVNAKAETTANEVIKMKEHDNDIDRAVTRIEASQYRMEDKMDQFIRDTSNNRFSYSKPRVIYRSAPKDGTENITDEDVLNGMPSQPKDNL